MKRWRCKICGYLHDGAQPPLICPVCGALQEMFEEISRDEFAKS
jgi:rubrerythrin